MWIRMRSLFPQTPWLLAMAVLSSGLGLAAENLSTLPDEILATGGQGTAQSGAGAALVYDQSAIHINPAMLYKHKTYDVNGSYIWPIAGRPFYKVAAIDGQTSKWTTAFEYTGFTEGLDNKETRKIDSPARRRASLAFAVPADSFSLGFAGHYVEAEDSESVEGNSVKGFTLGAGLVLPLSSGLSLGASLENFNNKKIRNVAPKTLRAGIAWQDRTGSLAFHADYRDRERSEYLEGLPLSENNVLAALDPGVDPKKEANEKMAIIGAEIRTMEMVRMFVSGGKNVGGEKAQVTSGGLGLFQKNFSIAYAISKIYPDSKALQSSLSLSITMKM